MKSATSVTWSPRSPRGILTAAIALVALAAGCGTSSNGSGTSGGGNSDQSSRSGSEPVGQASEATSPEDSPGIANFDDSPVVGTAGYQGPSWMDAKMAVLLPDGLTVTIDQQDPANGGTVLTGFIADGDIDELVGDAKFMVNAAGYFVGEEFDNGSSKGFGANISVTGDQIRFGVAKTGGGDVQWSMEFSNSEAQSEALDNQLAEAGFGTEAAATVRVGESQWEIDGGWESEGSEFVGIDDGVTLSVGISESDGPAGSFSDPELGVGLLIPTGAPVTEFNSDESGFTIVGQIEGFDYSINVRCDG